MPKNAATPGNPHLVFVYGTLLKGYGNHKNYLDKEPLHSNVEAVGRMLSLGGFPGVVDFELADSVVHGEIYEVDDATLHGLDSLEGYRGKGNPGNFYDRISIECTIIDKETGTETSISPVYTYQLSARYGTTMKNNVIDHGSWRQYTKERENEWSRYRTASGYSQA